MAASLRGVGIFGASTGSDFPSILHLSLPIDDFISDVRKTEAAFGLIREALSSIEIKKNDDVVLACNTAHIMQQPIEAVIGIPLKSLLDVTLNKILDLSVKSIGLLASPTTVDEGLHTKLLARNDIKVILPSAKEMTQLESVLRNVISMKTSLNDITFVNNLIEQITDRGAEAIILGCTELSTLKLETSALLIDPLDEVTTALLEPNSKNKV